MGNNDTEIIIYQSEDGAIKIDVRMESETVWLSLDQLAELFQRDRNSVVANYATTAADGKTYQVGGDGG